VGDQVRVDSVVGFLIGSRLLPSGALKMGKAIIAAHLAGKAQWTTALFGSRKRKL